MLTSFKDQHLLDQDTTSGVYRTGNWSRLASAMSALFLRGMEILTRVWIVVKKNLRPALDESPLGVTCGKLSSSAPKKSSGGELVRPENCRQQDATWSWISS